MSKPSNGKNPFLPKSTSGKYASGLKYEQPSKKRKISEYGHYKSSHGSSDFGKVPKAPYKQSQPRTMLSPDVPSKITSVPLKYRIAFEDHYACIPIDAMNDEEFDTVQDILENIYSRSLGNGNVKKIGFDEIPDTLEIDSCDDSDHGIDNKEDD